VVHWRFNLFKLPQGNAGRSFVSKLARLYGAFTSGSALESIAFKAVTVLPLLVLKKPSCNSKITDHIACIVKRLPLWLEGQLDVLVAKGNTLQGRLKNLPPNRCKPRDVPVAKVFADRMFQGKVKSALDLLTNKSKVGLLHLDGSVSSPDGKKNVRDLLRDKHPLLSLSIMTLSLRMTHLPVDPIVFDSMDKDLVCSAAPKLVH